MKRIEYVTQLPDVGQRLDAVLAKHFNEFSRAQWQTALNENPPMLNGKKCNLKIKLKLHQTIKIYLPKIEVAKPILTSPKKLPEVLYEDKDVIVINKPAGLLTHPTERSDAPSVAGAFASKASDSDKLRPGIVHRLDKDTSGVMILAKNIKAKEFLQSQFKNHKVKKSYLALIEGKLKQKTARIELPIARSSKQPNKMEVSAKGRSAVSQYKVIAEYPNASLVEISLLTGRTHQIRVQFAYLDHSVVGDKDYGIKKLAGGLDRQFLHSKTLVITLPSGDKKIFTAELPDDLNNYLKAL